jgi:hypothetical protein
MRLCARETPLATIPESYLELGVLTCARKIAGFALTTTEKSGTHPLISVVSRHEPRATRVFSCQVNHD